MIELIEVFCQLIAVVGDATGAIILAGLRHNGGIFIHLLDEFNLFFVQRSMCIELRRHVDGLAFGLS